MIEIYNKCTLDAHYLCNVVSGAKTTLSSPIITYMTDNGDGTYTYSYSVQLDGAVSVVIKLVNNNAIDCKWYGNTNFADTPVLTNKISVINFFADGTSTPLFAGYGEYFTAILSGKIKAPTTDTFTFYFYNDDGSKIIFDGEVKADHLKTPIMAKDVFSVPLIQNNYYDFIIYYYQAGQWYHLTLNWSTSTMAEQNIPSSAYIIVDIVGSSPYQNTVSCPTGYSGSNPSYPTVCKEICGDGIKVGSEQCDDGNLVNGDGCSSTCTIDYGFVCSGGTIYVKDTCVDCTTGFYPNSDQSLCITHCGDSRRAGSEACDDGNIVNGDGCSSTCTIETGASCYGGSITSKDTCVFCSAGFYQNTLSPTQCITKCGDGFRAGSEKCDDKNSLSGDGCLSDCSSVEAGCVCSGGSPTSKDTCTKCDIGFYQNDVLNPTQCVSRCGDGIKVSSEACDDGNLISGDGCSSTCRIEYGFVCSGGTIYVKDTCVDCTTGFYPNSDQSLCITHCGDSRRAGSEACDDGNIVNGDGCSSTCTIETGASCYGGSITSKDTCVFCSVGFYQNTLSPTQCITKCGDGLRAGSEKCDDGNNSSGDGCLSDCSSVEAGCVCSGGSLTSKDTCIKCDIGFYQNDVLNPTQCVSRCGDGIRVNTETCDDGNLLSGDGCSSTCRIESGFACSRGSIYVKDTCVVCSAGLYPNADQSECIPHCGDGFRAGSEKCDDGNSLSGDGCLSECSSVEAGFVCSGGSPTSKDTCTKCGAGLYQNNALNPTHCVSKCGDGFKVKYELCDDGNIISGDGCSSDCLKIESGWACFGGYFGIADVCVQCDLGYDPNPDYSKCIGATVPRDVNSMAAASQIGAYMGIASNLVLTVFSSSSSSSSNSFGMLNQIQLVILLPLVGAYIPEKIYDYLKSMNTSLFNLNFLPTSNSGSTISFKSLFDFKQPNSYLYLLQLNSGSALVNILSLTTTVGFVIVIHILLLVLLAVFRKLNRLVKLQNLILKLVGMLTFGFYIGVCLETFILFLLVDISEIHYQNKNGVQNVSSTVASYCIVAAILSFMFLALWQWWKSRKPEVLETMKYFVILVEGMKTAWICRSYWLVFLVRRTVFICIIFFMEENEMIVKVALFVSVQAAYFAYILILRPHDSIKENLSDFINEIFYLYYVVFLLYFNTEDRWDDTTTEAYFWILMSNNFILIFIMLVSTIKSIIVFIRKLCNRRVKPRDQTSNIEPYINGTSNQLVEEQKEAFRGSISKDNLKEDQINDKLIYEDKSTSNMQRIDQKINSSHLAVEDINDQNI